MERKVSAPPQGAQPTVIASQPASFVWWPFSIRNTLISGTALVLLALVALGSLRETTTVSPPPSMALSRLEANETKPAYTRPEEAYIQALWPIHAGVERTSASISLGNIFYKTNDLSEVALKGRVEAGLAFYRKAEARIAALEPPQSFAQAHENYLAAIRLFEQAAVEEQKMFEDRQEEHLLAAHSFSQEASNKIRELGIRFWQDEYPPN